MGKVFVIKDEGRFNLSGALKFGSEIISIFNKEIPVWSSSRPFVKQMESKLMSFNSEEDYILVVGDPVGINMAGAVLVDKGHRSYKLLKWDNRQKEYFPVEIVLD